MPAATAATIAAFFMVNFSENEFAIFNVVVNVFYQWLQPQGLFKR